MQNKLFVPHGAGQWESSLITMLVSPLQLALLILSLGEFGVTLLITTWGDNENTLPLPSHIPL